MKTLKDTLKDFHEYSDEEELQKAFAEIAKVFL